VNKTTEALKLAEEALVYHTQQTRPIQKTDKALAAIREAKAELEKQEPVAWAYIDADGSFMDALDRQHGAYQTPLYAAPVDAKAIRAEDYIKAYQQGRKDMKEEAAKVCDFENHQLTGMRMDNEAWAAKNCAAAIRGLK